MLAVCYSYGWPLRKLQSDLLFSWRPALVLHDGLMNRLPLDLVKQRWPKYDH